MDIFYINIQICGGCKETYPTYFNQDYITDILRSKQKVNEFWPTIKMLVFKKKNQIIQQQTKK